MKKAEIKIGALVQVQFRDGGEWHDARVTAFNPNSTKGVTIQGTGERASNGVRGFYTSCDIAAKWLRPVEVHHDLDCPLCGKSAHRDYMVPGVHQCLECGAVVGRCYKGDSYKIVSGRFVPETFLADTALMQAEQRYYDLTVLGSTGIERRHGWFWFRTGDIVQVG